MGSTPSNPGSAGNPFAGKTFAISGTLVRRAKAEARMSIEARGGRIVVSPSKKTHYFLAGDGAGTKLAKARELGVTVLSEDEFDRMIQAAGPITEAQRKAYQG